MQIQKAFSKKSVKYMISKYLGDKIFWKVALRLALPIALQNLLVSSFTLVDTIMVGQLGDVSLSAVGMAGQWSWLGNMILFGICSGASVFVSQYWGVKDIKGIHRVYGIVLISSCSLMLVFSLLGFFAPRTIMRIFTQEQAVIEQGVLYLRAVAFSYPFGAINFVFSTFLRSTERVKLPMVSSFAATLMNIFFNYALIFGKFGFPQLGIEGAAIATFISTAAGPLAILIISAVQKNILLAPVKSILGFTRQDVLTYYKKAAPVIFNEGMWGLGTFTFNIIFSNLGYEHYAAVTILKTFENIAFVFFVGLCNASCIMIGKSVGSGFIKRAVDDSLRFSVLIPLAGIVVGALIIIFRPTLISVFNFNDNISQQTIDTAMLIMMIYGMHLPIRNIPYIQVVGIFRPGGDTVVGAKYDLLCLWCISLPATLLAAFVLKLPFAAVFATMYIFEDYLKSFLCIRHYRTKKWVVPVTEQGRVGLREYLQEINAQKSC